MTFELGAPPSRGPATRIFCPSSVPGQLHHRAGDEVAVGQKKEPWRSLAVRRSRQQVGLTRLPGSSIPFGVRIGDAGGTRRLHASTIDGVLAMEAFSFGEG
jgi:hypothetical protein